MKRLPAAVAVVLLVLTGCGGEPEPKPEPSATAARAKLSEAWTEKFEVSARESPYNCVNVTREECPEWLAHVRTLTRDLEKAIEDQRLERRYPETLKQVRTMERASDVYGDAECEGASEGGPDCSHSAQTLANGASLVPLMLRQDELRYELDELRGNEHT
ncbi:hypothetical protein ACFRR7_19030 [Streptomyces sp. NPDC056909]|uniref:hypothetical protein n=1 Tax=Streptomyces sp. NPDC056909 TaxID=3345963 RepID=UPI0036B1CD68